MPAYIALFRAVNLAGRNMVRMSELRDLAVSAGCHDVRSLLQSGNLVFRSAARDGAGLERRLEAAAASRLGLATHVLVRSADEWQLIVEGNPFAAEAKRDPARLGVMLLKQAPAAGQVAALLAAISGREIARVTGRHAYIVYPDGIGRSRLTTAVIEKALGTRGTARNWNTVVKLGAAAGG